MNAKKCLYEGVIETTSLNGAGYEKCWEKESEYSSFEVFKKFEKGDTNGLS